MEGLAEMMRRGFEAVDKKFDEFALMVQGGFRSVDKRFDEVDKRFDEVDKRVGEVDKKFGEVVGRNSRHSSGALRPFRIF